MTAGLMIGIAAAVLVLICVVWAISVYNGVNKSYLKYQEAESGIDVALTKRHDMLTKLLASAKKYQGYEEATILETIKLRKDAPAAQKMADAQKMDQAQNVLFGLAENYPDLKASLNWQELQRGIEDAEEHLQAARRSANSAATQFNNYKVTFPAKLIAGGMQPERCEYYEATEEQKQDVVIE